MSSFQLGGWVVHPGRGIRITCPNVELIESTISETYWPSTTLGALLQVSTLPHAIPQASQLLTQRLKSFCGNDKLPLKKLAKVSAVNEAKCRIIAKQSGQIDDEGDDEVEANEKKDPTMILPQRIWLCLLRSRTCI